MRTANDTSLLRRERELERAIVPAVEAALPGVEVLAVELVSPSRFCIYVDHPAGVDHALCERVTYLLDDYRSDYTIDVSSPGPERPLRTPAHYRAVVGRRVQVKTDAEFDGRRKFRAEVCSADDAAVTLETTAGTLQIPYEEIVRGNLIDEGDAT
jgi:ribosome maturation factor RimP